MPRVADVLLVHHATIGSPSRFSATKVRFVALGFVEVMQVNTNLYHVVIIFPFGERKLGPILVGLLTIS